MTKSRISLTPLGMAKPKIPSERPPVPSEDRWDISDDPIPASAPVPVVPSTPPGPMVEPEPPAAPSAKPRAQDPLRTTLALGDMPMPAGAPKGPASAASSGSVRPPSSAPGPSGVQRDIPPTPTLGLESKELQAMLRAQVDAALAAQQAQRAGPSNAPPSAGVPASKPARVGGTTLALEDPPAAAPPKSAALPASAANVARADRPAVSTMVFSPSELAKAAQAQKSEVAKTAAPPVTPSLSATRIGGATLGLEPEPVPANSQAKSTPPPSAGRMGAPAAALSKTLVDSGSDGPVRHGTLVMAAPVRPVASDAAAQKPANIPATAKPAAPQMDSLSSTIVGVAPTAAQIAEAVRKVEAHGPVVESPAKGPVGAAKSAAPSPSGDPFVQTLVGNAPTAAMVAAALREQAPEPAVAKSEPSASDEPSIVGTETLRSGTPDASFRTVTTPAGYAPTLASEPVASTPVSEPVVRTTDPAARASEPSRKSEPVRESAPSVAPRASRPVIAAVTPSALAEASARTSAVPEEQPEVGESALRIALAAAGTIVVSSAVPALLRDPVSAATWTIPGVIAVALAFVPVGHATRALLAFAPALPALAVRAMGCEGHTVLGALALTATAALLPAALLFRGYLPSSRRGRALLVAGLAIALLWALLPGGGGLLAGRVAALSVVPVMALSASALAPGRAASAGRAWAVLAMLWMLAPALGARVDQLAARALDALSLAGLGAIAACTLAALLAVYAPPEEAAR